mmetsp:Transcript_29710/g.83753  ORF Transcript_29710/g.83753 Transcript_29710/m.83753 type:complete len:125 (-) Transcript_29710:139-513(-)
MAANEAGKSAAKLTLTQTFSRYGKVAIILHAGLSIFTTAGFYTAITNGVKVEPILARLGLAGGPQDGDDGNEKDAIWRHFESYGVVGPSLAAAYLCNKALMPIRTPITIALTPIVARWVQRVIH